MNINRGKRNFCNFGTTVERNDYQRSKYFSCNGTYVGGTAPRRDRIRIWNKVRGLIPGVRCFKHSSLRAGEFLSDSGLQQLLTPSTCLRSLYSRSLLFMSSEQCSCNSCFSSHPRSLSYSFIASDRPPRMGTATRRIPHRYYALSNYANMQNVFRANYKRGVCLTLYLRRGKWRGTQIIHDDEIFDNVERKGELHPLDASDYPSRG